MSAKYLEVRSPTTAHVRMREARSPTAAHVWMLIFGKAQRTAFMSTLAMSPWSSRNFPGSELKCVSLSLDAFFRSLDPKASLRSLQPKWTFQWSLRTGGMLILGEVSIEWPVPFGGVPLPNSWGKLPEDRSRFQREVASTEFGFRELMRTEVLDLQFVGHSEQHVSKIDGFAEELADSDLAVVEAWRKEYPTASTARVTRSTRNTGRSSSGPLESATRRKQRRRRRRHPVTHSFLPLRARKRSRRHCNHTRICDGRPSRWPKRAQRKQRRS